MKEGVFTLNIKMIIALALSKCTIILSRLLKNGGTSLPGKVAKKIYPDILKDLAKDYTSIIVTGTNGKTTSVAVISQILKENKIEHIVNKSGANLENGIITMFVNGVDIKGKLKSGTVALIEADEAAFRKITDKINPNVIVVTNFFKDQLDRFGEVTNTVNMVKEGIEKVPNATVVLNADDHRCASIGKDIKNNVLYYGIKNTGKIQYDEDEVNQSNYCVFCKSKFKYDYHIYAHMGGFKCSKCGYERPEADIEVEDILNLNTDYSEVSIRDKKGDMQYPVKINLPGVYNIYNGLAGFSCSYVLKLPVEKAIRGIESFHPGFGRMETLDIDGKFIKIILVKNPTGFNEVINHIVTDEKKIELMFLINDNYADGQDVSWLWDVNFEKLTSIEDNITEFFVSGIRGDDMAVRLKYAGITSEKINSRKNIDLLLDVAIRNMKVGEKLYILPTYTAMLNVRKLLQKRYNLEEFWK